jgi:hypothetical protein
MICVLRVVLAVGLALAVPLSAHARPAIDACGLLTHAEVAAAIGEPVKTAKGGVSSTGAVYCNWTGNDTHVLARGIALNAATDFVGQRYRSYLGLMKPATPVHGIGVAAVTDGTAILARSTRTVVEVAPLFKGAGITLAAVETLAKKALARAT